MKGGREGRDGREGMWSPDFLAAIKEVLLLRGVREEKGGERRGRERSKGGGEGRRKGGEKRGKGGERGKGRDVAPLTLSSGSASEWHEKTGADLWR